MTDKNVRITPPYCDKGFTLLVNSLCSVSRCFCALHSRNYKPRLPELRPSGFTLAEVLIALVVIGIIAAITMTTVMPNIQERANSQRQANIVYKVTEATNLMKANGALGQFASTDAFVDELQKYLKIMKRCDSEHIAECWPTKTVRTSKGKEYEVSKAKTRDQLGFKTNRDNKNVGIVLNDGACLIMTYDPTSQGLSVGSPLIATNKPLPVGGKYEEFLEYTTNTTGALAFVMDVNGAKGPNSETIETKMHDIRNLNGAHFDIGCGGVIIDEKCYAQIDSYDPLDCTRTTSDVRSALVHPENTPYCAYAGGYAEDYYAGAMKACADLGLEMPDGTTLANICTEKKEALGIRMGYSGNYRSSSLNGIWDSYVVNFNYNVCWASPDGGSRSKKDNLNLLCVEK